MKNETTNVHYCSPTNSTKFTNCCGLAVIRGRDLKCPECGKIVNWNLK